MKQETLATLIQEGSKLLSDLIRIHRAPVVRSPPQPVPPPPQVHEKARQPEYKPGDLDYRWECVVKHLGGASVILREAFERANDEGIGEGTAEKIVEALNEHSAAEPDIEKMLPNPEAKPLAERLLSGIRAFRSAAWEARLPTGGGTKQDVEDAKIWNSILLSDALEGAKKHPGTECIKEGM